jgi:hypothetical protein
MKSFKPLGEMRKSVDEDVDTELRASVELGLLARLRERFESSMRRVRTVFGGVEEDAKRKTDKT